VNDDRFALRDLLFAAVLDEDEQLLVQLCWSHAEAIVEWFGEWARVPEELRDDARTVESWVLALYTIAEVMHGLGHPQPMERLSPSGTANPVRRWTYMFSRAQDKHEEGEPFASTAILRDLLADMEGSRGPFAEELQTKVYGLLGANAMRLGEIPDAVRYTEQALQRCVASGDHEGEWIYTENLDTVVTADEIQRGTAAGRQLARCRERIAYAQDLSDAGRHPASNDVLGELRHEVDSDFHAGRRYLGKIYGLLGLNHFRLGSLPTARRYTELALTECRRRRDLVGDSVYTANLKAIDDSARQHRS
jgi:hypothetical protein